MSARLAGVVGLLVNWFNKGLHPEVKVKNFNG